MGSGISTAHACPPRLVPVRPPPIPGTEAAGSHTRVTPVPSVFCKRHHVGLPFAEDLSRISGNCSEGKTEGPGTHFGERSGKWPVFLISLKTRHTLSLQGARNPPREQRDQTHRATWSKRGLRKRSWGAGGAPRGLASVVALTGPRRDRPALISYSRSAQSPQRTHCAPQRPPAPPGITDNLLVSECTYYRTVRSFCFNNTLTLLHL